jgi:hypothetical protein
VTLEKFFVDLGRKIVQIESPSPSLLERVTGFFAVEPPPADPNAVILLTDEDAQKPVPTPFVLFASGEGWAFDYDPVAQRGIAWFQRGRPLDAWQIATPLRVLMSWIAEDTVLATASASCVAHAAAVTTRSGSVVIGGPSGAGKSTLAALGVDEGLRFIGDDWIHVEQQQDKFFVCPIYRSLKTHSSAVAVGTRSEVKHPKKRLRLVPTGIGWKRVKAVIVPRAVDGSRARIAMDIITPGEAARALIPSTVLQTPGSRITSQVLSRLVESVPCVRLEFGYSAAFAGAILRQICDQ